MLVYVEDIEKRAPAIIEEYRNKITEKVKLNDGDEFGLGGITINGNRQEQAAYFLVRIGACT